MPEFSALSPEQQEQIALSFTKFAQSVECQKLIAVIRDTLRRFEESDYQRLLSKMASWTQVAPMPGQTIGNNEQDPMPEPHDGDEPPPIKSPPRIEYVPSRSVRVSFNKAWLADESDVESYLVSMREALLAEINKGKRIQI